MTMKISVRGNALLVALIAMALVTMLVAGAIVFTGQNQRSAVSKTTGNEVKACADLARRYIISRLKVYGQNAVPVTDIQLVQTVVDDVDTSKRSTISTKHYDGTVAGPTGALIPAQDVGGGADTVRDVANVIASTTLGGNYYGVVVLCEQPGGRQAEVEFVFKFGI
jgi:hypothetical protein